MYSEIKEQKIRQEFSRLKNICFLDHAGATLYSEHQMEAVAKDLCSTVYGNPHSLTVSSRYTTDVIDQVRYRLLHHFNTDCDEYSVIFTSGATASLKLVAECFDWTGEYTKSKESAQSQSTVEGLGGKINDTSIKSGINNGKSEVIKDGSSFEVGYSGAAGDFVYLQDNHTSVLGMRTLAEGKCDSVHCLSDHQAFEIFETNCIVNQRDDVVAYTGNSLFVYPAQSNFSGVKYPLSWITQSQDGYLKTFVSGGNEMQSKHSKWFCMLDAASFVSTQLLDLSEVKPDFVCISFYKMFGYPTGLGALLVRNTSAFVLHKKYFGGGTVLIALSNEMFHVPRPFLSDRFEDGTLPFLSIVSLRHGFDTMTRLVGDMRTVAEHTLALAQRFFYSLLCLHHCNGSPVAILYCDTDYQHVSTQGAIVNFNLLRANKEHVGFVEVLNMANLHGIQLRTGCFCNPGACQKHLGLTSEDIQHHFQDGHVCGDDKDLVDGKPTGSVRVSFGYMSNKDDVDKLLSVIINCFVDKPAIKKMPDWWAAHTDSYKKKFSKNICTSKLKQVDTNCETDLLTTDITERHSDFPPTISSRTELETKDSVVMKLTHMFLYPVKSCAALPVSSWTIGPRGLAYDRQWMVVSSSGVCLTQKQETRLCLIRPTIDFQSRQLILDYPGMNQICVPLDMDASSSVCRSKVCRDRVLTVDCGDIVADWLSQALFKDGLRLIRQLSADARVFIHHGSSLKYQLSLSNQAQFLLLNQSTIDWLAEKIEDTSECSAESLLGRFRCNLVVSGCKPFEENDWAAIQIGDALFKSAGVCTRCQMVCIDQSTGDKTAEPLRTLSASLQGKIKFGIYFSHQYDSQASSIIQVGAPVNIFL